MHIYPHLSKDWVVQVIKRLNIGCYCSLCARAAHGKMDLCLPCKQLLCTARRTDRSGRTCELCAYCGDETITSPGIRPNTRSNAGPCRESRIDLRSNMHDLASTSSVASSDAAEQRKPCRCSNCSDPDPLFEDVVAPYRYVHPIDGMIKRLKYAQDRQLARVFGALLADVVAQREHIQLPELLVPMPLHPSRQSVRGFNQAQDIAYWAGKKLQVPMAAHLASRQVDTGSLAGLTRQERQHRILGAFRAEDALLNKRVAIVDDVLTTGASARELAREIYDSGAGSVELWVLARTSSLRSSSQGSSP